MRRFSYILTVPLAVILVVFAIDNRRHAGGELLAAALDGRHAGFLALFLALLIGFFAGAAAIWLSGAKARAPAPGIWPIPPAPRAIRSPSMSAARPRPGRPRAAQPGAPTTSLPPPRQLTRRAGIAPLAPFCYRAGHARPDPARPRHARCRDRRRPGPRRGRGRGRRQARPRILHRQRPGGGPRGPGARAGRCSSISSSTTSRTPWRVPSAARWP